MTERRRRAFIGSALGVRPPAWTKSDAKASTAAVDHDELRP
jgi:hypothetical protein